MKVQSKLAAGIAALHCQTMAFQLLAVAKPKATAFLPCGGGAMARKPIIQPTPYEVSRVTMASTARSSETRPILSSGNTQRIAYSLLIVWAAKSTRAVEFFRACNPGGLGAALSSMGPQEFLGAALAASQLPLLSVMIGVLAEASVNGRQPSDTYKRLNLGIAGAAIASIAGPMGRAVTWEARKQLVPQLAWPILAAAVGLRVWALASPQDPVDMSIDAAEDLAPDTVNRAANALEDLGQDTSRRQSRKGPLRLVRVLCDGAGRSLSLLNKSGPLNGVVYGALFYQGIVAAVTGLVLPGEQLWGILAGGAGAAASAGFTSSARAYGAHALAQLGAALALKDAADRDRLDASTFKRLNLAVALMAALKGWALGLVYQRTTALAAPVAIGTMGFFAVVFVTAAGSYAKGVQARMDKDGGFSLGALY